MRKYSIIYLITLANCTATNAQKPFINAVEAKTFIYQDFYEIRKWKNFFADGYQRRAYNLDTLQFSAKGKGGAYPGFNSGWGVKLALVKGFLYKAKNDVNRLEWALGIGYRKYTYKFDGTQRIYDDVRDTLWEYPLTSVGLAFIQNYVDINTTAIYKLPYAVKNSWFYIGLTFQASLPYAGKIHEDYKLQNAKWNTGKKDWIISDKAETHNDVPTKKVTYFYWGIPFGASFKVSKKLMGLAEVHYWHNSNRKYYSSHKDSHALNLYLAAGMRYNF